ncbi:ead/Ea22-like family protein [Enterobacter roggenkampii]|uniref:ead/Ea22-like family protein n=1 Tax=Enterobacter roggenkampii TaxID=1812935 RepID=UPI003D7E2CAF
MSNIDKKSQKELYAKVEQQAHSLRGSPREYQAVTGMCPVNVIEMHAQKIQALLDELEAKDSRIGELEVIATDYGMKFQRAQDALKHQSLLHKTQMEAAEKRIAELSGEFFALPPLNDDLIAILGRPNFTCAHLAELLRKGGQDIRRKAEHEQAAVIYWFLDLYLKYGEKWESIAKDDIRARVAMITAAAGKGEAS